MSYIDAIHDKTADRICVVERTTEGNREFKEYPTNYVLYYEDPKGKHRSLYNTSVTKFSSRKQSEFEKEKRIHSNSW